MAKIIETLKQHIWHIAMIAVLLIIVLLLLPSTGDDQRREDIANNRQELQEILKNDTEKERYKALKELAKKVGAGYVNTTIAGVSTQPHNQGIARQKYENHISESELVLNINNALQTETMIDMCNISAGNYKIAGWATMAAAFSAFAAWWPTICKRKDKDKDNRG
ncbi:MAG: hypothetical protein FVQ79_03270 [Planctomycetes bacterium]|nr:hypothetical protein [Planctomycetota bacterium]